MTQTVVYENLIECLTVSAVYLVSNVQSIFQYILSVTIFIYTEIFMRLLFSKIIIFSEYIKIYIYILKREIVQCNTTRILLDVCPKRYIKKSYNRILLFSGG